MQIVWTEAALRDLASIRAYIAGDNPRAAERQLQLIFAAIRNLEQFSELGRAGRLPGTRELVVSRTPYLAAYRVHGDAVEILRVLHGRQRWPAQL